MIRCFQVREGPLTLCSFELFSFKLSPLCMFHHFGVNETLFTTALWWTCIRLHLLKLLLHSYSPLLLPDCH